MNACTECGEHDDRSCRVDDECKWMRRAINRTKVALRENLVEVATALRLAYEDGFDSGYECGANFSV